MMLFRVSCSICMIWVIRLKSSERFCISRCSLIWSLEGSAPSWVGVQLLTWWPQEKLSIEITIFEPGVDDVRRDAKIAISKLNNTCSNFEMGPEGCHEMAC